MPKTNNRISLFFMLFFLWIGAILSALDPERAISQYYIHSWDMESGLPANSIYAICQTRDGYLWIGTQDGLVRFDGLNFKHYNRSNTSQLGDNIIRALYADREGTLWIGTLSGGLTCLRNGQFQTYSPKQYKSLDKISVIGEDHQSNLWIGSIASGLTLLKEGQFITYTKKNGILSNQVTDFYQDENRILWVVTASGIFKVKAPGIFESQNICKRLRSRYFHTACLVKDSGKELLIGTGGNGLFQLKNGALTSYSTIQGISHSTISILFEDRAKNLWIGTDGGGLVRMNRGSIRILSGKNGLKDGFISAIYEDIEGILWIGTLDGGLHQLIDSRFITYTSNEGLADNYILCIYEDCKGNLWAGTKGGLCLLKNDKWRPVLTVENGLASNMVVALSEDFLGNFWIGTRNGLHRLKEEKIYYYSKKSGISDLRITTITTDNEGIVWVGTQNGLNRFDKQTDGFIPLTDKDGLKGQTVELIFQDSRNNLLVGTNATLNLVKERGNKYYAQQFLFGKGTGSDSASVTRTFSTGITRMVVRCAYEDKQGIIWLGTDSGLIVNHGNFSKRYTIQNGLNENHICAISEDNYGYLWLAGRKGVCRIRKKEIKDNISDEVKPLQPYIYNEHDGMKSRWITDNVCRTHDNKLWFPTSKGVSMVDPASFTKKELTIPVMIEEFLVDGSAVNLMKSNSHREPIELSPGKRKLEFFYTAAGFYKSRKISFKTKLQGYDAGWVDRGNLRNSTYTELSPGHYTFKVIACNSDGVWNKEEVSLSFYLKPHFYQTIWFYILTALMTVLFIYGGYQFRIRQLKNKAKELSILVEKRTSDLVEQKLHLEVAHQKLQNTKELIESKNKQLEKQSDKLKELDNAKSLFFANISHEFRTPLTLIMGPLEQILSEKHDKNLKAKAHLMLRNSQRLLNLVNQLLELAKFESGKLKMQFSNQNIVPFLKSVVLCFHSLAQQNEIQLDLDCKEEEIFIYYDQENLERIITNLLSNAFNYTPKGGQIVVSLQTQAPTGKFPCGSIEIKVKDTGIGIPENQIPHIFDRFYRGSSNHGYLRKGTGIGLALTKELVELHHGQINVKSSCQDIETRGTCFNIDLPLGSEHLSVEEVIENSQRQHFLPSIEPNILENSDDADSLSEPTEKSVNIGAEEIYRILVVEDNTDVRKYIKNSLEPCFLVEEACNGIEGIAKACETVPDLVVSDIMMPEADGYELCKKLKTNVSTSHIPIILLTAKMGESDVLQGLHFGADDYITKPFNTMVLVARIRNLIDLRRQLQIKQQNQMVFQPDEICVLPIDEEFYLQVTDMIEKNIHDTEFNVKVMAKKMGIGRTTLHKKIKAVTGESPNQFLRNYRLKQAAQLLTSSRGSISDIAVKVGFSDFSYFAGCFKERFGQSPSQYRTAHSNEGVSSADIFVEERLHDSYQPHQGTGYLESGIFEPETARDKACILLVDDNRDTRQYIREWLEPQYRIEEAGSGRDGIQFALESIPDLIVSDIMMPDIDGYELCKTIKNDLRTSHIPIVLLTAKVSDTSIITGLEIGADDYITKPFNREILNARIKNLILLRRQMQFKKNRQLIFAPDTMQTSAIDQEFIQDLQKVIDKHLDEPEFGIKDLCKKMYMGRTTLYRKVLALCGETPSDFIRSYRLKRAAQLLRQKTSSVLEVSVETGFSSSSYFAKCFKEKFHQLPSEYIESH